MDKLQWTLLYIHLCKFNYICKKIPNTWIVGQKGKHILKCFVWNCQTAYQSHLFICSFYNTNFYWTPTPCQALSQVLGIQWWKDRLCSPGAHVHAYISGRSQATSLLPALTLLPGAFELFPLGRKEHLINVFSYISVITPEGEYHFTHFLQHIFLLLSSAHLLNAYYGIYQTLF